MSDKFSIGSIEIEILDDVMYITDTSSLGSDDNYLGTYFSITPEKLIRLGENLVRVGKYLSNK